LSATSRSLCFVFYFVGPLDELGVFHGDTSEGIDDRIDIIREMEERLEPFISSRCGRHWENSSSSGETGDEVIW
jgi:hypothetical protein